MKKVRNAGFTLIEIVMVLVLLGILAAVAVPKYFDLQEKAEIQAAKAMVAEVQARINGEFANAILDPATAGCTAAREVVTKMLTNAQDAASKIEVTQGYTIEAAAKAGSNDLWTITVKKGSETIPNTDNEVSVPVCAQP